MEKTIVIHKTPVKQLGSAFHKAMNSVIDASDMLSGPFMEYQAMLRLGDGNVVVREMNRDADNFLGYVSWTYEDGIGEGAPAEGYYGRIESGFSPLFEPLPELPTILPATAVNTTTDGSETVDIKFTSEGGLLINTAHFSLTDDAVMCYVSIKVRKRAAAPKLLKATTDTRGYFVRLLFDKPVCSLFGWIGTNPEESEHGYIFEQHLKASKTVDVPLDPETRLMEHGEDYYLVLHAVESVDYGLHLADIADPPVLIANLIREAPLVVSASVAPDGESMDIFFDRNMAPPQEDAHLGFQVVVNGVYRPAEVLLPFPTERKTSLILEGFDPVIELGDVVTLNRFPESLIYPIMSSGGGLLGQFTELGVDNDSTITL